MASLTHLEDELQASNWSKVDQPSAILGIHSLLTFTHVCCTVPGTQLQWTASRTHLEDELQAANSHPAPSGDTDMHRLEQRLSNLHLDMWPMVRCTPHNSTVLHTLQY